jgi:ABC-2 type transport system ATP-binding protein
MIQVTELTKRYDKTVAVDGLDFEVPAGTVTGFLGPNGAGKSTTMRMVLGLDKPTAGRATVNGRPLAEHRAPLREIGALLEAKAVHPRRTARDHLRALAATTGITNQRVDHVIDLVGLDQAADRSAGGFSLGMGQRLGIASALLGDPETIMLDEPVNGLDPEGILWIRSLLTQLANEGRTVFVSSHLMSEMAMIAERFVIIGRGRLIADVSAAELEARGAQTLRVRSPQATQLHDEFVAAGARVERHAGEVDAMTVTGICAEEAGSRAASAGLTLFELAPQRSTLEDIFMELTHDAVDYHGGHPQFGEATP